MSDDTLNSNFEWKKKSFDKKERLSRRIDANQASLSDFKRKDNITNAVPLTAQKTVDFDRHLKKMRKQIKQNIDDDEEEDEDSFVSDPLSSLLLENAFLENQLFESLSDAEKEILMQHQQTQQNLKLQKDIAKLQALADANAFAKKAGLPKLSPRTVAENMQHNGWGKDTFRTAVEHYITPDIDIGKKLDPQKIKKLMSGIKRLQKIGGISAVQGMKINEVIHITDKKYDDKKVAQLLLKKTGRNPSKTADKKREKKIQHPQKVSFKKLIQRRQEQTTMKV